MRRLTSFSLLSPRPRHRWVALACLALACGPPADEDLATRGKRVYRANCIVCHHIDPALPGGVGPEIVGSSAELLRARLLSREYPPGYVPKRDTALMPLFPALEADVPALEAYLSSANAAPPKTTATSSPR